MQQLEILPTYKSPKVNFDPQSGLFQIQGSSILVNAEEFYSPLLNWMDEFLKNPTCKEVKFIFDIEYVNVASTKRFMLFLNRLAGLHEKGVKVTVDWLHDGNDQYMIEVGEDLSQLFKLNFNFVALANSAPPKF